MFRAFVCEADSWDQFSVGSYQSRLPFCLFICQVASTMETAKWFLRSPVKLPPVTTRLTTQR